MVCTGASRGIVADDSGRPMLAPLGGYVNRVRLRASALILITAALCFAVGFVRILIWLRFFD
jgi:hypothetical protein